MQKIAIIIPCYNEEKRISREPLQILLDNTLADIYLCNDGSNDNTASLLATFCEIDPARCFVHQFEKNEGKANAIYKSVTTILAMGYEYIGYFDADFSTPPSEIIRMIQSVRDNDSFVIGSRVKLLSTKIERRWYRHVIGRIIVTIIDFKFNLGVYDTQCGAKIFSLPIAKIAFAKPFATSWLFDVEIFIRLKDQHLLKSGREFPLMQWKDIDGSKLNWTSAFKIIRELYILQKKY